MPAPIFHSDAHFPPNNSGIEIVTNGQGQAGTGAEGYGISIPQNSTFSDGNILVSNGAFLVNGGGQINQISAEEDARFLSRMNMHPNGALNELKVEDIKVGDYVSVLYWDNGDQYYLGDVLEVSVISIPYFFVIRRTTNKFDNIHIDCRVCHFCSLTPEYIKAASGIEVPKKFVKRMTRYDIAKARK
jgi:hypothetical protein